MHRPTPYLLPLTLSLSLLACSRGPSSPTTAAPAAPAADSAAASADSHLPPGIDWYAGDVAAAFAAAAKRDKPLFLYWGAQWCPPCAQIRATIFSRREFQDRSRLFVPLYLDGDTPSAQQQAERFGVVGYPTMILFRADGTEITRLPGGVDVARYASILDIALTEVRPVGEIVTAARKGADLSANDWRLLAYYDWAGDQGRVLPKGEAVPAFATLVERCPANLAAECGRILFGYCDALAQARRDGRAPAEAGPAALLERLLAQLAAPEVVAANVQNLLYGSTDVIGTLTVANSPQRTELLGAWRSALARLEASGDVLSPPEQLNLVRAKVLLARLERPDAALPPALLEEARTRVAAVDRRFKDGYERHAAINAAANLLREAGLDAEANDLLTAELARSASPYYFMLELADLAQRAGREDEAIGWLQRAYQDSKGPATRFQWGYNYLVGLIEMKPGDTATIESAGLSVLGELEAVPDAFHQRTQIRLAQLSTQLLAWGSDGERARVVEVLHQRMAGICARLPEGDAGRRDCEAFLDPALSV